MTQIEVRGRRNRDKSKVTDGKLSGGNRSMKHRPVSLSMRMRHMLSDAEVQGRARANMHEHEEAQRRRDEHRLTVLSYERLQRYRQVDAYIWALAGWGMANPDHQPSGEAYEEESNALHAEVIRQLAAKIVDQIKV